MKRSLRRYQQRVAKVRRVRMFYNYFRFYGRIRILEQPWQAINRPGEWLMNNPGWWNHEMTVVPSRIHANRLLHRVKQGQDSDGMVWPDYRRPHIYFW